MVGNLGMRWLLRHLPKLVMSSMSFNVNHIILSVKLYCIANKWLLLLIILDSNGNCALLNHILVWCFCGDADGWQQKVVGNRTLSAVNKKIEKVYVAWEDPSLQKVYTKSVANGFMVFRDLKILLGLFTENIGQIWLECPSAWCGVQH